MNNNWRTDRPKQIGAYLVTLAYPEIVNDKETGNIERAIDIRWMLTRKQAGVWVMNGENNDEELVWTEQSGSWYGEKVIAWMPLPEIYEG